MQSPTIIKHFENQAKVSVEMGSPFLAHVCTVLIDILDEKTRTGFAVDNWPGDAAADALALRICGGFHAIALQNLDGEMAAIYRDAPTNPEQIPSRELLLRVLIEHDDFLAKWLKLPPQTNETGRAGALLPGLLEISRQAKLPIELCEIGSSAGLNLNLDRFFYDFNGAHWGDANSAVQIKPELKAAQPNLSGELNIVSRKGCDISPVDIMDTKEQLRLRSYAWADQKVRLARLEGAIKIALEHQLEVLRGDASQFVRDSLENRQENAAFVLMHSVVWQYLPQETQDEINDTLEEFGSVATAKNPIYWLRLEGFGGVDPHAGLSLDAWPNYTHQQLARSCFHGSWIEFAG